MEVKKRARSDSHGAVGLAHARVLPGQDCARKQGFSLLGCMVKDNAIRLSCRCALNTVAVFQQQGASQLRTRCHLQGQGVISRIVSILPGQHASVQARVNSRAAPGSNHQAVRNMNQKIWRGCGLKNTIVRYIGIFSIWHGVCVACCRGTVRGAEQQSGKRSNSL